MEDRSDLNNPISYLHLHLCPTPAPLSSCNGLSHVISYTFETVLGDLHVTAPMNVSSWRGFTTCSGLQVLSHATNCDKKKNANKKQKQSAMIFGHFSKRMGNCFIPLHIYNVQCEFKV